MERPPRIAEWMLRLCLHDIDEAAVLGDIEETFLGVKAAYGLHAARRWYWSQALYSGPVFCIDQSTGAPTC